MQAGGLRSQHNSAIALIAMGGDEHDYGNGANTMFGIPYRGIDLINHTNK